MVSQAPTVTTTNSRTNRPRSPRIEAIASRGQIANAVAGSASIVRFDGQSGAFAGVVVSAQEHGLVKPRSLAFAER